MSVDREAELLECPVCWEYFNLVENVPYVLWCGHTLCKTCVFSLRWATVKFPTLPVQLPLFISCPWCQLLCFRLVWKGNLRFPNKNFFLLWLVESANRSQIDCCPSSTSADQNFLQPSCTPNESSTSSTGHDHGPPQDSLGSRRVINHLLGGWRVSTLLSKILAFSVHLIVKFPLVIMFMLIAMYAIMVSVAILGFCKKSSSWDG
ncbi:hypothetical protein HHK36_013792 [Tetracentron sinense]|uniref:RING-type domain-containing protein n=1 Tax=Tetracentron sinense TaxID=13715 RepID=A0A834Z2R5_TETSI|nr:hypothetical protein HHK36_013792 [Tetracentron sinense]